MQNTTRPLYASMVKHLSRHKAARQRCAPSAKTGHKSSWALIEVSAASTNDPQAARVCVDFVNHAGIWLLDIYRPVTERLGWLERARSAAILVNDHTALVLIINNLGIANLNFGRPKEALRFHKEALKVARRIGHLVEEAHALSSIGICLKHLGRYQQALQWYEKVICLGHPYKLANLRLNAFGNMGIANALLRKPEAACKHFARSLEKWHASSTEGARKVTRWVTWGGRIDRWGAPRKPLIIIGKISRFHEKWPIAAAKRMLSAISETPY